MTLKEIIAQLKLDFPVLRVGSDENGYTELSNDEYEIIIEQWANAELQKQTKDLAKAQAAEAKEAAEAKLAALGLTPDDLRALGL